MHQSTQEKQEVDGLSVKKTVSASRKLIRLPPTEPPLFQQKQYEMIANGIPIISATSAYLQHPNWNEYGNGRLYFQKIFGKSRYIKFSILNKESHNPEYISNKAEHEIIDRYGVMAARLHAVFATYATHSSEPWREPFFLKGSQLIKTLRIYRTKKLTVGQKLKAIADLAWVVGTLGIVIYWHEEGIDLCVKERSLLWFVSVQEYGQLNSQGEVEAPQEVVIRVQPGIWAYNFLNRGEEKQKKALHQYGLIPKQIFDLDPHRQKLTTSIALYITQKNFAHKREVYTIENLLNQILHKKHIEQAITDRRYGQKLKESFDNALLTLKNILDLEIEFDDKTYYQWLRPVWSLPENLANTSTKERNQQLLGSKKLPNHYIINHWFPAFISFIPPENVQEKLQKLKTFEANKDKNTDISNSRKFSKSVKSDKNDPEVELSQNKSSQPVTLTGTLVKQRRKAIGMSQAELAQAMGRSQSWVRDLETKLKEQIIKPKYVLKLKTILKIA
ncbi:MAG: helix-turn-helix domain-containing protein [Richelia sp. RM2_1_2]|nr:helix-turn-helix domain-containing protein [Richelia sp. SM1_7_0]NJN09478.1 helix-turn-helix domain-containing protein [Richelia sp. RM1_1_1]NJO26862.1 helix-turn-helix domain-containing protein [Richelia sp. SL_2_1]NJO58743.1 helix-turn-helix domain-containing protein [Richelia sp. RM2_1_2]